MASDFPGNVDTFTTHHDNPGENDVVEAADINKLQDAVVATQTFLKEKVATTARPDGLQPFTYVAPAQDWNSSIIGYTNAEPGWFVDAAGWCHWQGVVRVDTVADGAFILSGAPAPADGRTHLFKPVFGQFPEWIALNAKLEGGFIHQEDVPHGESVLPLGPPSYYVDTDGWVHLKGMVREDTYDYGAGAPIVWLPRPADGDNHLFTVFCMLGTETASPGISFRSVHVQPDGHLMTGPDSQLYGYYAYSLEGITYQAGSSHGPMIEVAEDGRAYSLGLPHFTAGITPSAANAVQYQVLDGILYYVGL